MKKSLAVLTLFLLTSLNAFSQTQEEITQAINEGNCVFLYDFLQDPEGKERRLLESARLALEKYTKRDAAASRYRTNRMEVRVRNVRADLMENVFVNPQTYLPLVVESLIAGLTDPFMKVKVINDWICHNIAYDADHYFGIRHSNQDYISVLKNKKGVCAGYVSLFNEMCKLAGIESIEINGFSKGAGYDGTLDDYPDHAWNAVRINNKWYLVDVTWNAGYLEYYSYIKRYSTDYLFLDSRAFLYTHLPVDDKYQFYAPLLTKEQFVYEPNVQGAFFNYGLEFADETPGYSNIVENNYRLRIISRNSNVTIFGVLATLGQEDVSGGARRARSGNIHTITYNIPDTQTYLVYVYAGFSERRIWYRIPIYRYEQEIVPMLDRLRETGNITEIEKNHFLNSYYKIEYNGHYYFIEDQFDTARTNAVIKVHPLVGLNLGMLSHVLQFYVRRE